MLQPVGLLFASDIWNNAATEVKGIAVQVGHNLRRVGVYGSLYRLEGFPKRANLYL